MSTRIITPISWHSPPKCLQVRPWPNSCSTLITPRVTDSSRAFWKLKNSWKAGSRERKTWNCTVTSISGRQAQQDAETTAVRREEPADLGIEPVEEPFRVEALEADAEDVGQGADEFLAAAFAAALEQLLALAAHGGDHQPAAVQHAQELLQLVQGDLLRGELVLEPVLDLVQAGVAVEPLQDGVFLFLEAEVVQPHRVLDDPVGAAQVVVPPRAEVGPLADRQLAGRNWRAGCREGLP